MFARGPKNVWSRCVHFTSQILWKKYKFCDDWILGTRHLFDIKFWRILDVDIVIFITSNASKIDSCQNFGCRQIETIQNQGIASRRSLDKNTFPLAETVFPLAEIVFPLTEIVFPLVEAVFPLRETVLFTLTLRTCLLGARKMVRFLEHVCSGPEIRVVALRAFCITNFVKKLQILWWLDFRHPRREK